MPRGDATGPMGRGSMTGRAAGYCAGVNRPGYGNDVSRPRCGMGFKRNNAACNQQFGGGRRGFRNWFFTTGIPGWMRFGRSRESNDYETSNEKPDLKMDKQALKNQEETEK